METDQLIKDLYSLWIQGQSIPYPDYFKQYKLSDKGIEEIWKVNEMMNNQRANIPNAQQEINMEQMKFQMNLMKESAIETAKVTDSLKYSLKDALGASKFSQKTSSIMYIISFGLGLVLIISALVFAALEKPILAVAFGAFGMVDIVAHFIADPPARLQESRSNYVQLIGLTLAWFKETINNDACLTNLMQFNPESLAAYNQLSENYVINSGRFFKMMEDLAEPKKPKSKKSKRAKKQSKKIKEKEIDEKLKN